MKRDSVDHWSEFSGGPGPLAPLVEAGDAAAQADLIARREWGRPVDGPTVEVGPVARAVVDQQPAVALLHDAGVRPPHAGIAEQTQVARLRPSERHLGLRQDQLAPRPEARLDAQPGLLQEDLGQADQQADAQ